MAFLQLHTKDCCWQVAPKNQFLSDWQQRLPTEPCWLFTLCHLHAIVIRLQGSYREYSHCIVYGTFSLFVKFKGIFWVQCQFNLIQCQF